MRKVFTNSILTVLVVLVAIATASCKKKEVKKIAVDNQFAVALFNDTISLKKILHDMDSTTNTWLRVRNDSIFAFYADSVNGVIKASDFLGAIPNMDGFNTVTEFTLGGIDETEEKDTTLFTERFTEIPFEYDGFDIEEVVLRSGTFSFDVEVTPLNGSTPFHLLKQIVIFSEQLVSQDGVPMNIVLDYGRGRKSVDLADYKIIPDTAKTVAFSSRITFHYDPTIGFDGGDYQCDLTGSLTNVGFKTVYAVVTKELDSVFNDHADIDFGINGLSGSAYLPVPKIELTYRNTFGLSATSDVTRLEFYNSRTGLITDLLAADHWEETIEPTNGRFVSRRIGNFVEEIDALAGYTRLDFDGNVMMAMPGDKISISDTSTVDVISEIEMPLSFRISDLHYTDTIKISFGDDVNIQNYLDEIDFTIDFDNKIPLQITLQGLFMKNGTVIDSLFDNGGTILYNEPGSLECIVTDRKMKNVLRANQMLLRLGVTTQFDGQSQPEMVILKESNDIALRMKMLTKSSEINLDDIL